MQIFKCNDCGTIFDSPRCVSESRGEFWGMPAYEDMYYCPHCGGEDFNYAESIEELERQD